MLYNLRIGTTRYTEKTMEECINIIRSKYDKITAAGIVPANLIRDRLITMNQDILKLKYYDNTGKVYLSINRRVKQ